MTVTPRDGTALKLVVTGMIVSDQVLAKLAEVWKKDLFGQRWADLVGSWCVDYFRHYSDAPRAHVKDLFHIWAEDQDDAETERMVWTFLGGLSDEYEAAAMNPSHVLDVAGRVINRSRLTRIRNRIDAALSANDLERAEAAVVESPRVEVGEGAVVDVFASKRLVKQAVLSRTQAKPLIAFPGAFGAFTEILFEAESFVGFEAPEKRGKSFFLQEMAWQAVLQGRRVAFFSCGDLSEVQMMRRLVTRAVGRPLKATKPTEKVRIPTFLEMRDGGLPEVTWDCKAYPEDIDWRAAWATFQQITKTDLRGEQDKFRLSTHGTGTLSVIGLRSVLKRWAVAGWRPEVVVVDYADIMAPPPGTTDVREGIDRTWIELRSLSIGEHLLVLTASQTNAASYSVELIGKGNFSGSKTKNAHVTAMLGINQSPGEKERGVYRLNLPAGRDSEFGESSTVTVAGCLSVANPIILSSF